MNGGDASIIGALRGPVTLITIGVLFALNNFTPYGFGQTWPVLLIVFGLLSMAGRSTGHQPPTAPPPPPHPPAAGTGAPGYRQSQYPDRGPGGTQ